MELVELQSVLEEAVVNYDNNRLKDSESAFRYLLQSAVQSKNPVDTVYFCYRLLDIQSKLDEDHKSTAEIWKNLGIYSLKIAEQELKQVTGEKDLNFLEMSEQIYRYLLEKNQHQQCVRKIIDLYSTILSSNPTLAIERLLSNPYLRDEIRSDPELLQKIFLISEMTTNEDLKSKISLFRAQIE